MTKILKIILVSLFIPLGGALILILSQRPVAELDGAGGLDFAQQLTLPIADNPLQETKMRDGYMLQYRAFPSQAPDAPLVVLVHGSGWHGRQFVPLARALSHQADVLVPDLRGHGALPGQRGDVAYIGQFEDDLADLIKAHQKPNQRLVMAGHSSGGGLVVRFAGGAQGHMLDGAVLMAPFLKHDAPTTRADSGGWAQALTRRIIGLSILNTFRIKALNHLTIIQFNMPKAVLDGPLGDSATTHYSYRLNTSFAPRADYLADVAALPDFLLLVGSEDEAFYADQYEPTLSPVTDKGRYQVIADINHLDIVTHKKTQTAMEQFLEQF